MRDIYLQIKVVFGGISAGGGCFNCDLHKSCGGRDPYSTRKRLFGISARFKAGNWMVQIEEVLR